MSILYFTKKTSVKEKQLGFINLNLTVSFLILKKIKQLEKIRAITILKTLSKKEIAGFEDFLNSPYFNKGKKYIARFFKVLKKYYPDFRSEEFLKKEIYKKLYPKEPYSDLRFRKLSSELYKLLLEFLAAEEFFSGETEYDLKVLRQLNDRKLGSLFEQEMKTIHNSLQKTDLRNDRYSKSMYELISAEKYFYFQRKRNRSLELYDTEMIYFTRYAMFLFLSKYIERAMEIRFFRAKQFSYPLFREIISFLKNNDFLADPVLHLLYLQLTLCLKDDDECYFELRKLLKKTEHLIDKNQLKLVYTILSNYAAERSEKGIPGFQEQILDVNLEIIKKDLTEQYISGFLFVNIVTLFIKFNKISELRKFISDKSDLLNPDIKEDIISYCRACLSFQEGDPEKALRYLSKINFDHYQLRFRIKILTLKIFYETEEYESIYFLTDSFRHILKREKDIPESIKKTISSFLKILKQLADIRSGSGFHRKSKTVLIKTGGNINLNIELLSKEIEKSSPAEKHWLKEKISEF